MFSYTTPVMIKQEVNILDIKRKKELLEAYKNRHPEIGVISLKCVDTGESFLGISVDTKADFNSNKFKLSSGIHPNQRLQSLWYQCGESGFELSVLKVLEYKDLEEDHTIKLEALRDLCFAIDPQARRIWK